VVKDRQECKEVVINFLDNGTWQFNKYQCKHHLILAFAKYYTGKSLRTHFYLNIMISTGWMLSLISK
jgi:hypothetical protein